MNKLISGGAWPDEQCDGAWPTTPLVDRSPRGAIVRTVVVVRVEVYGALKPKDGESRQQPYRGGYGWHGDGDGC